MLPNLVIAGAPKCGTTSVHRWLSAHPQSFGARQKEVRYFLDHDYPLFVEHNFKKSELDGYEEFFPASEVGEADCIFETTPDYIYQNSALEAFESLLNEVKIIFILREPVDRLRSFFSFAQNNVGAIPVSVDINQYVNDLKLHAEGAKLPDYLDGRIIAQSAILHGCYEFYLNNWYDRLGADRISVYLFEDLQSNPISFMEKLSCELGIDPDFYHSFQLDVSNETLNIRSKKINGYLRKCRRRLRNRSGSLPYELCKKIYKRILSSPLGHKPPLSEESLNYLNSIFAPSNEQLRELTGLNLSSWSKEVE